MKFLWFAIFLVLSLHAEARIQRSQQAKIVFAHSHPCPSTHQPRLPCRGYVIDHIKPLDCGGKDAPSNMQWQTIAQGKAKDKWERCAPGCKHRPSTCG